MTKELLVVQSQGSPADPKFGDQMIETGEIRVSFLEYLHKNDIKTLEYDLINSCHGNIDLTLKYAKEIQALAEAGHKIVAMEQGGLYFAKPSLEAANMVTVPVISIPLDGGMYAGIDAFLAPQIPTGTAVIGGVGLNCYSSAAKCAKEILTNEFNGVYTFNATDKLNKRLDSLNIPILGEASHSTDGLVVGILDPNSNDQMELFDSCTLSIFSPFKDKDPRAAISLMDTMSNVTTGLYVRGDENVAIYAAKILSLGNPKGKIFSNLKEMAQKKADSYEMRDITVKSFTL